MNKTKAVWFDTVGKAHVAGLYRELLANPNVDVQHVMAAISKSNAQVRNNGFDKRYETRAKHLRTKPVMV